MTPKKVPPVRLKRDALTIAGEHIYPGERKRIFLDVGALYDYTNLTVPVEVIRGKRPGPKMFISAAIHGDELNGVEIIKRLLRKSALKEIRGTLIAVPVVNVFGFNSQSRYLPDRRDLNRSFPGSKNGSLASRLAYVFMREIVKRCDYGIDLHTGAIHRSNLPQIRANLDEPLTRELALEFGVPVIMHSELRDGSLREAARRHKINMLLFEGGEALRFDEPVIKAGLRGCFAVMRHVGLLPARKNTSKGRAKNVYVAKDSFWVRAPHGGSFRIVRDLGAQVAAGEVLAVITDPFGKDPYEVKAAEGGIIIGISKIPLVNKGDAMFHIATFSNATVVKKALDVTELADPAPTSHL